MSSYYDNTDRRILRNKMVALMYLIFIVLAFLYIPADFIDTIRYTNNSLENSSGKMQSMKLLNLNVIRAATMFQTDSVNNISVYPRMKTVSSMSDRICRELDLIKQRILLSSGGLNKFGYPKNAKDNQYADMVMLERGVAKQIRKTLADYKALAVKYGRSVPPEILDSIMPTDATVITSTGKSQSWEKFYFYKMPLNVSLAIISKFQNDIRVIESLIIDDYLEELNDKYDLKLMAKNKQKSNEINPKMFDPEAYIKNGEYNILYVGIDNPLKIYHPRVSSHSIIAEISSGEILKKDSLFYARLNKQGIVQVNAFSKQKRLIASQKFLVKELPDPFVSVGDRRGGNISRKIFKIQKNIDVNSDIVNPESYSIKNFSLIRIKSNGGIEKSQNNHGAFFNSKTRELIDQCQRGDKVLFENIEVESPDGANKTLSLIFTIT